MRSKVFSDCLPSYIKATRPVLEIFKMVGYFPASPRILPAHGRSSGRCSSCVTPVRLLSSGHLGTLCEFCQSRRADFGILLRNWSWWLLTLASFLIITVHYVRAGCIVEIFSKSYYTKEGNVRMKVTMRRFRVTIIAVEKQSVTYSDCVCCLAYPTCEAHAPFYIIICGLSVSTIFFHIIS